ncbi:hypothetical protein PTH_2310 [Pelotomaculum thermopropionicum SI]|uniref:Class IIb bacteriocin, lactobin A/cerein 7B family n=1 Tax=Pelotomaculum thermopropionicum (strain DSM 13744 / JCM 10971 / SI) TaxID=370438 RepID=A5CZV3_PELTS|nr:hypothetical protein PTH_2310 [Pelotomaculum thermopropionicum SI]
MLEQSDELSEEELEQVAGGVWPGIVAGVALVGAGVALAAGAGVALAGAGALAAAILLPLYQNPD